MGILILLACSCIFGFVLFSNVLLNDRENEVNENTKVSVIIPARNEAHNLPYLLASLKEQTYKPCEIIVVDDMSSDETYETAESFGVKVIKNTELPENWTGKSWALWNGVKESSGDILVFFDADVRLAKKALETLLDARAKSGGAISVVPYHKTEKFYEKLSLIPCILGVLAFTSPFERLSKSKGMYGSCIVMTKQDYSKIEGHDSIKSEVMDDLTLGKRLSDAGIPIENYIGYHLVSFRMYPGGLRSELEGFGKSAVLSMSTLRPLTILCIAIWFAGLLAVQFVVPVLILMGSSYVVPFVLGYIFYTVQIIYFLKYSGDFGYLLPVLHGLSSVFFIVVILYSYYQVTFTGSVIWKGRQIKVGRK
jgi:glycosyltransferase involved in cell wall biosynthesis